MIVAVFAVLDTLDYGPDRFTIVVLSTRATAFLLDKETGEVWSLHQIEGRRFVKVPVRSVVKKPQAFRKPTTKEVLNT